MKAKRYVKLEIVRGVEGVCVVINDYRVAGPKPWGGGTVIGEEVLLLDDFMKDVKKAVSKKRNTSAH